MKERNPSRVNRLTVNSAFFNGSPPRKHLNSSLFVLHSSLHLIQRCLVFILNILLNHQVVDDEVLTFHRILTHIILQEFLHLVGLMERNLLQSHIRTDEVGKLLW